MTRYASCLGDSALGADQSAFGMETPWSWMHWLKRKSTNFLFFVILNVLIYAHFQEARADEKLSITWWRADFPPLYIVEGPFKNTGYLDQVENLVSAAIPYERTPPKYGNYRRIVFSIRQGPATCSAGLLKTEERSRIVEYSNPFIGVYGNGVIIPDSTIGSTVRFVEGDASYNLEKALKSGSLRLGRSGGRVYGQVLDNIINTQKDQVVDHSYSLLSGMIRMIEIDRIDMTLGYAHELTFYLRGSTTTQRFRWLPVTGAPRMLGVYFACTKDEQGKRIIKEINEAIKRFRSDATFQTLYQLWVPAEMKRGFIQSEAKFIDELNNLTPDS